MFLRCHKRRKNGEPHGYYSIVENKRIDQFKTAIPFSKVLKLLVMNRLIKPGSEFYVHQHWFDKIAMDMLLDCDFTVAQKNRLYQLVMVIAEIAVVIVGKY